jgi:hypothetical protein
MAQSISTTGENWVIFFFFFKSGQLKIPLPDTLVYRGRKPGQRTASVHFHFLMINFPFNLIFNKGPKCFRSVTFWYGSVRIRTKDLRIRIPLFLSMTFKIPIKNIFLLSSSAYRFLKVRSHHLQIKYKVIKSHKTVGIKVFLTISA